MKTEWKDETSYSKDDKERVPNIYILYLNATRISVHKHIHHGDAWLLSCYGDLSIDKKDLQTEDLEVAKANAFNFLRYRLTCILSELGKPEGDKHV